MPPWRRFSKPKKTRISEACTTKLNEPGSARKATRVSLIAQPSCGLETRANGLSVLYVLLTRKDESESAGGGKAWKNLMVCWFEEIEIAIM